MRTVPERLVSEQAVELHLCATVKAAGGLCIKLNPFSMRGIPDRLVLMPGGMLVFVELKKPKGSKFEPLQERWHDKLRTLGFIVSVCYTKQQATALVEQACSSCPSAT